MYERVLLAYDGSRQGAIALREGALLAKRFGAQVYLLSVIPETEGVRITESISGDVIDQQVDEYKALLGRAVAALKGFGLSPVAKLVVGDPAPAIGAFAREVAADLVVLGHRRQNLLQRWWSGSTGSYVSDHVSCSVLIGRKEISDETFQAEMLQGQTR
jgi:nucleotide-binding universal stress UspA family protein